MLRACLIIRENAAAARRLIYGVILLRARALVSRIYKRQLVVLIINALWVISSRLQPDGGGAFRRAVYGCGVAIESVVVIVGR